MTVLMLAKPKTQNRSHKQYKVSKTHSNSDDTTLEKLSMEPNQW